MISCDANTSSAIIFCHHIHRHYQCSRTLLRYEGTNVCKIFFYKKSVAGWDVQSIKKFWFAISLWKRTPFYTLCCVVEKLSRFFLSVRFFCFSIIFYICLWKAVFFAKFVPHAIWYRINVLLKYNILIKNSLRHAWFYFRLPSATLTLFLRYFDYYNLLFIWNNLGRFFYLFSVFFMKLVPD